ncbi:MAG: PTS sugar transporter subunit IIA [Anaerostipes sp.]|uniref:PTS sugar transporter subunit IIA n=1 Tax=Anaerostipes sp. TaxID=1872530 RepID=UPI0039914BAF
MLWEQTKKDFIYIHPEADNPDQLFEIMGKGMIENGYCRESYIQALKGREAVFPTGIQIGDYGVAIPHTDPEHVKKSAVSFAVLKNPVEFLHMGTNPAEKMVVPVKFVIMLAIAGKGHLEMLQRAIWLIQDMDTLGKMMGASSVEQMVEIIKTKEETYENV